MKKNIFKSLVAIAAALICVGCVDELKEVAPAYNPEITDGEVKSVEFVIPGFVEEDNDDIQTRTTLTTGGFVWAEKDTVGIFPSKGNQIYYEMSTGAGNSSAVFDGGGWALKDQHLYSSYYPLQGNFYLDKKAIPVTYDIAVTQVGNDNSDHLGANAFMFAPETTLSNGKVTFRYWQLGSVLKPRVTLPAGTYTKLVLSTDEPIFVVSGKYDLTTGVDAKTPNATMPDFVPVIVPDKDKSGVESLTNKLTINLEEVTFTQETELIAYIMAAPVDVSGIPITVTIYGEDSPRYKYEFVRASSFVAQTNHNIRPNEKGLMSVANSSESANTAFASGVTSLSLVDVTDNANFDLVLPETSEPVSINMAADEGKCTMSVSYPAGTTVPTELNIEASNSSNLVINTPKSTVTLDGERYYTSVRAATASNTLIIDEDVTIGTLYLEKGNVQVYGEIMSLNTDDLEDGETPTVYVYGNIQGQVDDDDVTVRRPITAVTLDQTSLELEPSETVQLVATAVPENAIYETITWTSSNTSVATVSDAGLVTAAASGECTITVDIDGKQATCAVNVKAVNATDLSASGTANCYIVSSAGYYKFKTVQGNTSTSVGEVKGVKVLWESYGTNVAPSVGDLIKPEVTFADNYISFSTNDTYKEGNAVIAAYSDANCTDGNVLWSWHIWLTSYNPNTSFTTFVNYGDILMDRNLGALSCTKGDPKSIGLHYQWGRKDPFMGSSNVSIYSAAKSTISPISVDISSETGSIDYTIKNPAVFLHSTSGSAANWSVSNNDYFWMSTKTEYDPCPPGWMIPTGGSTGFWKYALYMEDTHDYSTLPHYINTGDYLWVEDDMDNQGIMVESPFVLTETWFPYSGGYFVYPETTYPEMVYTGSSCRFWTCSYSNSYSAYCFAFTHQSGGNAAATLSGNTIGKCNALPVRCIKGEDQSE